VSIRGGCWAGHGIKRKKSSRKELDIPEKCLPKNRHNPLKKPHPQGCATTPGIRENTGQGYGQEISSGAGVNAIQYKS